MRDLDVEEFPQIYRGIAKKRFYVTSEGRVLSAAFMLRQNEEGLSVIKMPGCSPLPGPEGCLARRNECYGEFKLETKAVIGLGLKVMDEDPGEEVNANHAEIRGVPLFASKEAEDCAGALAEIAALYYDRFDKYK